MRYRDHSLYSEFIDGEKPQRVFLGKTMSTRMLHWALRHYIKIWLSESQQARFYWHYPHFHLLQGLCCGGVCSTLSLKKVMFQLLQSGCVISFFLQLSVEFPGLDMHSVSGSAKTLAGPFHHSFIY